MLHDAALLPLVHVLCRRVHTHTHTTQPLLKLLVQEKLTPEKMQDLPSLLGLIPGLLKLSKVGTDRRRKKLEIDAASTLERQSVSKLRLCQA